MSGQRRGSHVAFACTLVCSLAGAARPLRAQVDRITPGLMAHHIAALADDSMRGRATPSPELELAAKYGAEVFRRAGLRPMGDSGGYVQRYPVHGGDASLTAPNVIAMLPGGDRALREDVIVAIAHVDHLGVGRPVGGDSIRNGADDNASGTAAVLALAYALSGLPRRPARSILFILVSGEERGLWGSKWYVDHPTVPIERIVGLVNLDMISRNRPDSIFLNGWGKSSIADLVIRLAASHPELGLSVGPDIEDRPVTPQDSDHWPFQRRGVPYIFFYSGEHPDYHRVSDEPARTDPDKAARVTRLAYLTLLELANAPARPQWDEQARQRNTGSR